MCASSDHGCDRDQCHCRGRGHGHEHVCQEQLPALPCHDDDDDGESGDACAFAYSKPIVPPRADHDGGGDGDDALGLGLPYFPPTIKPSQPRCCVRM